MQMKTESQIRERIEVIESDKRYSYAPATVEINAPLALIQLEMEAEVRTLNWVLKGGDQE